jgi:hypothetical protein
MKYIVLALVASALAGCVSVSDRRDTVGYYQPLPQHTHTVVMPRPRPAAQQVCVWEDRYNYRIRAWVREERCHWR